MQNITVHNYEAFLLDLSEGNLSVEDQLELDAFLITHPELAMDVDGFSFSIADPEAIAFSDKETLKKTETDLVSAETFIAYIEHQLTTQEEKLVEESCAANPSLTQELKRYQSTVSEADTSIVFHNKERLKRKPALIWFNFSATQFAAAASVALFLLLYMVWPSGTKVIPSSAVAHTVIPKKQQGSSSLQSQQTEERAPASNALASQSLSPNFYKAHPANTHTVTTSPLMATIDSPNNGSGRQQPDTLPPAIGKSPELIIPGNEVLIAQAKQQTVVDVITEKEDEDEPAKKKQGFWAMAGKALNNLNKAGVKSVDGAEKSTKENATYALTLGALSITHKTH